MDTADRRARGAAARGGGAAAAAARWASVGSDRAPIAAGRLHVKWPGVYAVGPSAADVGGLLDGRRARERCRRRLSFRSAAMLWGIRRTDRAAIEVTARAPGRSLRRDRTASREAAR